MLFSRVAFLMLLAGAAVACSDNGDKLTGGATGTSGSGGAGSAVTTTTTTTTAGTGGSGGDNGQPSDVYPAPHQAPPQVSDFGGPVLGTPTIYPVFFANDDASLTAQVADFASKVGATQYWAATTADYGVGAATSAGPIQLDETAGATIDDAAIQSWLAAKIDGDDPDFPADPSAIYVLHYPAGTTVTSGMDQGCVAFGGYHSNITLDGAHGSIPISYAVMPRCDDFDALTGIDGVTAPESHELLEAATDPFPFTNPAYAQLDDAHVFWEQVVGGGEIGDMCASFGGAFTKFPELAYTVQRTWSNASALAGHDPCVPALPGEVYFNAVPELNDVVTASLFGQQVSVRGVKIPVGGIQTIDVDLFSDGPTGGPWNVDAEDPAEHLDLSFDRTQGQNGEKLHLTIAVNSAGKANTETFVVKSTLGQQTTLWVGIVGN